MKRKPKPCKHPEYKVMTTAQKYINCDVWGNPLIKCKHCHSYGKIVNDKPKWD